MKAGIETTKGKTRQIIRQTFLLVAGTIIALFIGFEFMQRHMVAFFQSLVLTTVCLLLTGCYWITTQFPSTAL